MNPIKVDIFSSPGCDRCGRVMMALRQITRELGADRIEYRAVNVLDELDYAVKLGILSVPAIVIDGELVFANRPSIGKLKSALEMRLSAQAQ